MSKKTNRLGLALVIFIILAVLALTNPSREKHVAYLKQSIRGQMEDKGIAGTINAKIGITDVMVDLSGLTYNNYIVCSTLKRKDKTATFGILGNVIAGDIENF